MSKSADKILSKVVDKDFTFGFLIKAIRETEYEDMTQQKFSEFLGVSKTRLSDIENDRYNVSIKSSINLATKLNQSKRFFVATALQDMVTSNNLDYTVDLHV